RLSTAAHHSPPEPPPALPAVSDAPSASEEAKAEKSQAKPQGQPEAENPNSEKEWRKRFAEQRKKTSDAELKLDVLQREAQKADVQYYSDPQKAMQEQFTRTEINEKNAKIE